MIRAVTSVVPPVPKATTARTGLVGYWASAKSGKASRAARKSFLMAGSFTLSVWRRRADDKAKARGHLVQCDSLELARAHDPNSCGSRVDHFSLLVLSGRIRCVCDVPVRLRQECPVLLCLWLIWIGSLQLPSAVVEKIDAAIDETGQELSRGGSRDRFAASGRIQNPYRARDDVEKPAVL